MSRFEVGSEAFEKAAIPFVYKETLLPSTGGVTFNSSGTQNPSFTAKPNRLVKFGWPAKVIPRTSRNKSPPPPGQRTPVSAKTLLQGNKSDVKEPEKQEPQPSTSAQSTEPAEPKVDKDIELPAVSEPASVSQDVTPEVAKTDQPATSSAEPDIVPAANDDAQASTSKISSTPNIIKNDVEEFTEDTALKADSVLDNSLTLGAPELMAAEAVGSSFQSILNVGRNQQIQSNYSSMSLDNRPGYSYMANIDKSQSESSLADSNSLMSAASILGPLNLMFDTYSGPTVDQPADTGSVLDNIQPSN